MELHLAIKQAFKEFGYDIITDGRLVNILSDYHGFERSRTLKQTLKEFIDLGFAERLMCIGKKRKSIFSIFTGSYTLEKPEQETLDNEIIKCLNDFNVKCSCTTDVNYVVKCYLFGLDWIEDTNYVPSVKKVTEDAKHSDEDKKIEKQILKKYTDKRKQQKFDEWNSEYVIFDIQPEDALVLIDGQSNKLPDGKNFTELTYGQHTIEASASMYKTKEMTINVVKGKKQKVSLHLEPNYGTLSVKCNNSKVVVLVDGNKIDAYTKLSLGTHILKVGPSLYYQGYTETIEIKEGINEISINLTPTFREVVLDSQEEGVIVMIDGGRDQYSTNRPIRMLYGTHTIHFYKKGYHAPSIDITVVKNGSNDIIHVQTPKFEQTTGGLKVSAMPVGQKVMLDGVTIGRTPCKATDIPVGNHTVIIKGSFTRKYNITVTEGRFTVIDKL